MQSRKTSNQSSSLSLLEQFPYTHTEHAILDDDNDDDAKYMMACCCYKKAQSKRKEKKDHAASLARKCLTSIN
jgi:hypothetical protein